MIDRLLFKVGGNEVCTQFHLFFVPHYNIQIFLAKDGSGHGDEKYGIDQFTSFTRRVSDP